MPIYETLDDQSVHESHPSMKFLQLLLISLHTVPHSKPICETWVESPLLDRSLVGAKAEKKEISTIERGNVIREETFFPGRNGDRG